MKIQFENACILFLMQFKKLHIFIHEIQTLINLIIINSNFFLSIVYFS